MSDITLKQCSNPKCRKGKIGAMGGAKISFGLGAVMACRDCGAPFEEVEEFYPEPGNYPEPEDSIDF